MIAQNQKMNVPREEADGTDGPFYYLAKNEGFWWPYRSLSKALLQTQRNSLAYLEANRRLIDAMRSIIRREQDLVYEVSETALIAACKIGSRMDDRAPAERSEANEAFDRAMTGIRELGEAWIDAQVRSLDTMRAFNEARRTKTEGDTEPESAAA